MANTLQFPEHEMQYVEETLPKPSQFKIIHGQLYQKKYPMSPKHRKRIERQKKHEARHNK